MVELDGKPWFSASDVCKALEVYLRKGKQAGTVNSNSMRTVLLPGEHRTIANPIGFGQHGRPPVFINESGLYRFIMRCDKPNARPFQTWVTGTVLPTLRKEGVYVRDEEKIADASSVEDLDSLNDMIVGLMKRKTEMLEAPRPDKTTGNRFDSGRGAMPGLNLVYSLSSPYIGLNWTSSGTVRQVLVVPSQSPHWTTSGSYRFAEGVLVWATLRVLKVEGGAA